MVMEGDSASGGEYPMQCADGVFCRCTLETSMILWTGVSPINLIKRTNRNK